MNDKVTIFGSSIAGTSHMNGPTKSPKTIRTSKDSWKNPRPTRTSPLSFQECFSKTKISTYKWSRMTLNPALWNWQQQLSTTQVLTHTTDYKRHSENPGPLTGQPL